jgi:hypothetical protein
MKNSSVSFRLHREEQQLLEEILNLLQPAENRKPNFLYSLLGYLISAHLEFDPFWPHRERWIDDTTFLSLSVKPPNTVHVIGYINWGYAINASNGIYEPMEAENL